MSCDARAGNGTEPVWLHERIAPGRNWLERAEALATRVRYSRGQAIYEEDSVVDCWCRVVSGVARRFSLRIDGRRQIVDLLLPNDVFGFGTRGRHRFTVEAVVDGTVIARYPRARHGDARVFRCSGRTTASRSLYRGDGALADSNPDARAHHCGSKGRVLSSEDGGTAVHRSNQPAATADFARGYRRLPCTFG